MWLLQWLGYAYIGLGERRAARATLGELLELATSHSDGTINPEIALALYGLALAVEPDDVSEGARLAGAVAKLRQEAGGLRTNVWPQDEEMESRFEQRLVDALGREACEGARAAGAALELAFSSVRAASFRRLGSPGLRTRPLLRRARD